jgi:prohibitin 2
VRFQLLHDSVAVLHKFIGPNYYQAVVAPEIGSQAREVISRYTAQEVYTSRKAIQEEIRDSAQASLGAHLNKLVQPEAMEELDPKHYNDFLQHAIQILDTLVLSIELPPEIVAAINRQTDQYYQIQEAKYRVEREAEESERKQIEANGIAAFQQTVSQGISDSYLRWRGIEATLLLAQSPNAKIVVIGTGKDGLPIILGNVDTPVAPGQAPQPATPPAATPATPAEPKQEPKAKGDDTHPGGGASNETEPTTKSADASAGPASSGPAASSSGPLSLSDIKSTLSRITGALRSAGSDSSPAADTKVKP